MDTIEQRAERMKRRTGIVLLAMLDITAMVLAFKLAIFLRTTIFPEFYGGFPKLVHSVDALKFWWFFAIWLFFFIYEGLYSEAMPYWDEVRKVATASALATVGVFVVVSIGKLSGNVSRTMTVSMGVILVFMYPFIRIQIKALLRMAGLLTRRVIILGAGKTGHLILNTMRKEPNMGYEVIGFLDDDPGKHGTAIEGVDVLGPLSQAEDIIRDARISDIVIAMPGAQGQFHQALINRLQYQAEHILFVPDLFGMAVLGITVQHFFNEQAFALQMKNNLAHPLNSYLKLVFDYSLSAVLLAAIALPMAAMAILIKLTSRGPVLYRHERMGRLCVPFQCIKFRTMYSDADQRLEQILKTDPDARNEWESNQKLTN
ncbi:MAG: sugar transferase, partial [Thermodesulfovibrionales bacterium]|nr:sugar transferase [Thermodesulfovibrionales bacterium]